MSNTIKGIIFTTVAIVVGVYLGGTAVGLAVVAQAAAVATGLQLLSRILFKPPSVGGQKGSTTQTIQQPVYPPRWILGRARVGGVIVWIRDGISANSDNQTGVEGGNHDIHVVFLIAQGECDAIEEIYVNDVRVKFKRTATSDGAKLESTGTYNADKAVDKFYKRQVGRIITVWEYFKADGTQGKSIRDLFTGSPGKDNLGDSTDKYAWNESHKLRGISYVHVRIHQPGENRNYPLFRGFPNINFVVRGLKIKDPSSSTAVAEWTDNAALCRWWFLNERRGVESMAIDMPSFIAARDLSDTNIHIPYSQIQGWTQDERDILSYYGRDSSQYTINGVVNADDDAQIVEDQMDVAWQGYVVESGGKFYFKPGSSEPATRTISQDDIIDIGVTQRASAFNDRVNGLQWGLVQSLHNDYQQLELPPLVDAGYLAEDANIPLTRSVGSLAYVNHVIVALRLLSIQLRRSRINKSWNYTVKPGENFQNLEILPTDRVIIHDKEYGLNGERLFVKSKTVNEDLSVSLELIEDNDNIYNQTDIIPPPQIRLGGEYFTQAPIIDSYSVRRGGWRRGVKDRDRVYISFKYSAVQDVNREIEIEFATRFNFAYPGFDGVPDLRNRVARIYGSSESYAARQLVPNLRFSTIRLTSVYKRTFYFDLRYSILPSHSFVSRNIRISGGGGGARIILGRGATLYRARWVNADDTRSEYTRWRSAFASIYLDDAIPLATANAIYDGTSDGWADTAIVQRDVDYRDEMGIEEIGRVTCWRNARISRIYPHLSECS